MLILKRVSNPPPFLIQKELPQNFQVVMRSLVNKSMDSCPVDVSTGL